MFGFPTITVFDWFCEVIGLLTTIVLLPGSCYRQEICASYGSCGLHHGLCRRRWACAVFVDVVGVAFVV